MDDPELERIKRKRLREMIDAAAAPAQAGVADLDESTFDAAVSGERAVIVDFWASWCAPCRAMHPVFESLAAELGGRISLARVNVDACARIAQRHGVASIPTFIAFAQGREIRRVTGAVGESGIRQLAASIP